MKVKFRNILFASAAILAAVACNKEQRPDGDAIDSPILLSVREAGTTKALLDNRTFNAE